MNSLDIRCRTSFDGQRATCDLGSDDATAVVSLGYRRSELGAQAARRGLVEAAFGLIASQAVLEGTLELSTPLSEDTLRQLGQLGTLFRRAHAYTQRAACSDVVVRAGGLSNGLSDRAPSVPVRRAVLLWSGGKDCLVALKVLRNNNFEVIGVHANANFSAVDVERKAALTLAERYHLPLEMLDLDWDSLRTMIARKSTSFDQFPLSNSIPHGRDLVLVFAAAEIALDLNCSYVCAGYESDLWRKQIEWQGKMVSRHDVQSEEAGHLMDDLLHRETGIRFFSPIASLTEWAILEALFSEGDDWESIESCFWGGWCGKCTKCLRYRLVEVAYGLEKIPYQTDPLSAETSALERLLATLSDRDLPYWEEQVRAISQIVTDRRLPGDHHAARRMEEIQQRYSSEFEAICAGLTAKYANSLAPVDFEPTIFAKGSKP